jgi:hypothetical protein
VTAYDAGKDHEAKRLAVPIRTLVDNTKRSTSLLKHLGVQDQLGWINRGPPEPPPNAHLLAFGVCVIETRFDTGETRYEPALRQPAPDRLHPPVSFEDWWRRTILRDQRGNSFSRADLVLALANHQLRHAHAVELAREGVPSTPGGPCRCRGGRRRPAPA